MMEMLKNMEIIFWEITELEVSKRKKCQRLEKEFYRTNI
jgi:hypothetical protein